MSIKLMNNSMMKTGIFSMLALAVIQIAYGQIPKPGDTWSVWQKGYLDLHHINTGRGNAAYYVFPDGTTMLVDAGEIPPTHPRTFTPRNAEIRPNYSKRPHEWIVHYIRQVAPPQTGDGIDYALISHFHDDHFGGWYSGVPFAASGAYALTGITGVGDVLSIRKLLDRGYPDYDYPYDLRLHPDAQGEDDFDNTFANYLAFIETQQKKGMRVERFRAGSRSQIRMLHQPEAYPGFYIQQVKNADSIWTGKDSTVYQHFAPSYPEDAKFRPGENELSAAFVVHYGPFSYYNGTDNPGELFFGAPPEKDVETPMAKAIGEVDIALMDHHGNRSSVNAFQVKTFKPRVWIAQTWSADHPGQEVLERVVSQHLYPGPRDLFSTNMLPATKHVYGSIIDRHYKSQQGHIVVRVLPGGESYYVIILDDAREDLRVKDVFGPYQSKVK